MNKTDTTNRKLISLLCRFNQDMIDSMEGLRMSASPAEVRAQHERQAFDQYMIQLCIRLLSGQIPTAPE